MSKQLDSGREPEEKQWECACGQRELPTWSARQPITKQRDALAMHPAVLSTYHAPHMDVNLANPGCANYKRAYARQLRDALGSAMRGRGCYDKCGDFRRNRNGYGVQ